MPAAAVVRRAPPTSGLRLPLQDALDSTLWIPDHLYSASVPAPASPASANAAPYPRPRPSLAARLRALPAPPPACPRTQIRLLIGIMSRCCTSSAVAKRRSIRETWLQLAAARPELSVRFFVSQAESSEAAAEAARALEEEATQYGDLVVLPGAESYFELPLKTLELLGYALRSPCNFTHVLKTDDDVYVRPDRLLRVLEEGEFEFSVPIRAPADARTRFDGLYSGRYLERRAEQLDEEARRSEETRQRLQKFPRVPGARPLATAEGSTRASSVESRPSVTAAALQSEIAQRSEAARRLESAQQPDAASFTPEIVLPSAYHEVPDPVEGAAQHTLAQALSGARLALSRRATRTDVPRPWMQGVFVGQLDTNKSDVWPGWIPDRDSHHKWYLSEDRLSNPDARSLLGTRWISGWGYLLSRDVAQAVRQQAEAAAWNLGGANGGGSDSSEGAPGAAWRPAASPALSPAQRSLPGQPRSARPEWWGRLPWEDVLVAALAEAAPGRIGELFHHGGFKPAWNGCDSGTVLKHLDNDAPRLMQGLHAQQVSGLWDVKEVVCSTGHFQTGSEEDWRAWRNTLPDVLRTGLM